MAYLEFISCSEYEKPPRTTEFSCKNFRWFVALLLAILSARFPFWKAQEMPLLKAFRLDVLPETLEHLSSWLTPPFLFLILNLMIVAILISSGLLSFSSITVSELNATAANHSGNSSSTYYQDDSSFVITESSYKSTALVIRELSHADTPSFVSTIQGHDIFKTEEMELSTGSGGRLISSGSKRPIQTLECAKMNQSHLRHGVEVKSNILERMESSDEQLLSSIPSIFDFTDSSLTVKPPAKRFRFAHSEKIETLYNDCKASASPIKGRVSIELDDLHERIESFIAKAREQMRQQEQLASAMYSQRYVENDYGWTWFLSEELLATHLVQVKVTRAAKYIFCA